MKKILLIIFILCNLYLSSCQSQNNYANDSFISEKEQSMNLIINNQTLLVNLVDNDATTELINRLKEKDLIKASSNKDLEHLLTLQKSLLYFTTSLQGNRAVLEKIENNNRLTSKEIDTLRDVQIEIKQGVEMANICREILENTMNTYSSIISNNLNDIMKFLTSITLVISIPTMIASFLGMNVSLGSFGTDPYSFAIIIALSFVIAIILIIILRKKNLL